MQEADIAPSYYNYKAYERIDMLIFDSWQIVLHIINHRHLHLHPAFITQQ